MSCFENEGVCSPCNWFHENMTVFVAGACKKLRAWRKAQMEGGVSLFLKGKWLYLSTYKMKDSYWLERRAVACSCTVHYLLSRLYFYF